MWLRYWILRSKRSSGSYSETFIGTNWEYNISLQRLGAVSDIFPVLITSFNFRKLIFIWSFHWEMSYNWRGASQSLGIHKRNNVKSIKSWIRRAARQSLQSWFISIGLAAVAADCLPTKYSTILRVICSAQAIWTRIRSDILKNIYVPNRKVIHRLSVEHTILWGTYYFVLGTLILKLLKVC